MSVQANHKDSEYQEPLDEEIRRGETNNLLQHLWPRALSARAPGLEPKWVRIINGRNGFNEYSWIIPMQVYLIYYKNHNAPTPTQ